MARRVGGVYFSILLLICADGIAGSFVVPGLSPKYFAKLGDINFGVMLPISSRVSDKLCDNVTLGSQSTAMLTQAFEYAADEINVEGLLPGNVTLGFVVLDDCAKETAAAAQALAFLLQSSCPGLNSSPNEVRSYDVVGVIGSTMSAQTVSMAYVLGPAQIPLISFSATSDDLSNKEVFPYFLRTVAPDRFQFRAIFSIIQYYRWSYVSVVYMEGSYGENGFKQLRNLFNKNGICMASVFKVPYRLAEEEASVVAKDLADNKNARVVVVITYSYNAELLIRLTSKLVPAGTFIWIASDGWATTAENMTSLGQNLWDSLLLRPLQAEVPNYNEYFRSVKPESTSDPWFHEFWDRYFKCSLANGTCNTSLTVDDSLGKYYEKKAIGIILDTVHMLTNATARVLARPECRGLEGSAARACVTGPKLLNELKTTRQHGYTGWMELDENGDRLGRYTVKQVVPDSQNSREFQVVMVAEFDSLTGNMTMLKNITWAHFTSVGGLTHPESRCSWPCEPGEAQVPQEVTCCWLCQPCRVNEYLAFNGTRCLSCPEFTWPDPSTERRTCEAITPDSPELNSVTGGVQMAVALAGLLLCLAVFAFFHRHRDCRVIKASSRELSFLMLLAITIGYVAMITLITPPNDVTCRVNYLLFCLSFALIYGPLLIRALRIYRIFEAGKRSARRPRMIDSSHQVMFSFGLFSVQALLCLVVMSVFPTWHRLTMRVALEPYVELTCLLPIVGLASFLAYNLLLVAVCAYLAFKTRHLPDNFNESRFISMCVTTTLVIWLAFIPGYLLSFREHLKMLTLALALALNHTVALVFLFLPKVYAVLYLEGAADINATTVRGTINTVSARASGLTFGGSRVGTEHVNGAQTSACDWESGQDEGENHRDRDSRSPYSAGPNFSKITPRP